MSNFGVCDLNASQPYYNISYAPLSTSISSSDGTGAAGIVTDDFDQAASSTTMFSYASESSVTSMATAPATETEISFEPLSTDYTAVESTWAAGSFAEALISAACPTLMEMPWPTISAASFFSSHV